MAQGERWFYGDEGARENPEEALAGGAGGGPSMELVLGARALADTAKTAADAAKLAADEAMIDIAAMTADDVLSADEKPRVMQDYYVITTERAGILAQADAYGITTARNAYNTKVTDLINYLATLTVPTMWNDVAGNTTIVALEFRSHFQDVYTSKQTLLNQIYAAAKAIADGAQTRADDAWDYADQVYTLALGKARITYAANPPGSPSAGDLWFSSDTSTNCPDTACKGLKDDNGDGVPDAGPKAHRTPFWAHRWVDTGGGVYAWRDARGAEVIIAGQIVVGTLAALSANLGTITAGVLRNVAGSAMFDLNNSRIVFNNGTVVKVTGLGFGTASQFIEWVGLRSDILTGGVEDFTKCDESNAIQYLTITGTAFFKGNISTTNLTATVNNGTVTGSVTDTVGSPSILSATTGSVTATPSGGAGGYTYAWEQVDGTAATVNSATSATTTFSRSALCASPANVVTGRYRCKVTDTNGAVVYTAPVTVQTSHLYEPV